MNTPRSIALLLSAGFLAAAAVAHADSIFTVRQSYTVTNVHAGAKQVRGWFWMPEDRPEQKVIELKVVKGPESLRVTRDPSFGRTWLYAEVAASGDKPLEIITEFKVLRRAVSGMADESKARALTAEDRRAFAKELRRDEMHMEVNSTLQKIADDLAGNDTNPVTQAKKFFNYVIESMWNGL